MSAQLIKVCSTSDIPDGEMVEMPLLGAETTILLVRVHGVIRERLEGVFRTRTRDEWCAQLETSETCFAPVLDMQEAAAHPHNVARGTFIEVDGLLQPAPAPRFSRTPATTPTAGVEPGVDLAAALEGWGLQAGEIQALAQAGTVA